MFDDAIAERVRPLARAFRDGGFVRLTVRDDDFEVELRRSARLAPSAAMPEEQPPERSVRETDAIVSDVVGILRGLRPPVAEGAFVDGDRELAFIETLGIRNPVRSRGAGRIAAVYVTEGEPVEYGQPLFAIERA